jgi:Protein of unknown function (DUF3093)
VVTAGKATLGHVGEHRGERERATNPTPDKGNAHENHPSELESSSEQETAPAEAGVVRYRERLRTPWWWYPIAIGVAALLAAEFHVAGLPLTDWIPFGVLVPIAVLIVWSLGRAQLSISTDELSIRGAHIPLRFVSGAVGLDATTLRRVVGREGDPQAFVSIRPWIGPGVQVWLADPEDPTPYWVISTRQPSQVVTLLRELIP